MTEREKFGKAMFNAPIKWLTNYDYVEHADGRITYEHNDTEMAWLGWQAKAADTGWRDKVVEKAQEILRYASHHDTRVEDSVEYSPIAVSLLAELQAALPPPPVNPNMGEVK